MHARTQQSLTNQRTARNWFVPVLTVAFSFLPPKPEFRPVWKSRDNRIVYITFLDENLNVLKFILLTISQQDCRTIITAVFSIKNIYTMHACNAFLTMCLSNYFFEKNFSY